MSRDERIEHPDLPGYARTNAQDIYRMITGSDPYDLREMVRAVGGKHAAAQIVGRHVRTVERWITTTATQKISRPRADAFQALRRAAERARRTQAGRRQILSDRRERNLRTRGVHMRGRANAGPLVSGKEYRRERFFSHQVSQAVLSRTVDAYLAGGEEAAYRAFNIAFGQMYELTGHDPAVSDFIISDMSALDFTIPRGEE